MQHKKVSNSVKFIYIATTHNNGHVEVEQRKFVFVMSTIISIAIKCTAYKFNWKYENNRRSLCQFKI